MHRIPLVATIVLALALPAGAMAEGKGKGKPPKGAPDAGDAVEAIVHATFTEIERRLIHEFFGVAYHGGGGGGLPPGLQRQLDARGRLPPGLAGKALPPGLAGKLGAAPAGHKRLIVDDDVLLIHIATGIVVDAVLDVVRGG